MVTQVTVPGGPAGSPVATFTFQDTNQNGIAVAQTIAKALASAATNSKLNVTSIAGAATTPTAPSTAGVTQEVYVQPGANNNANVTAGYGYIVNDSGAPATISAAPNTLLLTGSFGGVFNATGAATIVAAGGNNAISQSGAGAIGLFGGDGNDTFSAAGAGTVGGAGGANLANLNGNNQLYLVSAGASDSIIFGTGASDLSDTISAVSGANFTVFGAGGSIRFTNGGQAESWRGGFNTNAVDTITGGGGTLTANADPVKGILVVTGSDSVANVNGGTGGATVYGGANAVVNLTGSAGTPANPMYVVAGNGNETLNASGATGSVWLSVNTSVGGANAGAVQMIGGSAADFLLVGGAPGSAVMTGGGGNDTFVFFKQAAASANTITDFGTSSGNADAVFIEGYGYGPNNAGASVVTGTAAAVSGGVQVTLNGGTTILFSNFNNASALQTALSGKLHTS